MRMRQMTLLDIPAGMRLKDLAGWNQTRADWELFLSANPDGCFVAEVGDRVAGTVTTTIYEGCFAWIGMVLVDPEFRGRGIGRALLQQAIEFLDGRGIAAIGLDATPQGRPIYEKLGFAVEFELERWRLKRPAERRLNLGVASPKLEEEVLRLDREVFGADRSNLLRALAESAPEFVQALSGRPGATGYALGRRGSHSDHLGPWIADNECLAGQLLDTFLERSSRESVIVDCPRINPWAIALAGARGFELARQLTRMRRGKNLRPGRPEIVCGILGPEFG